VTDPITPPPELVQQWWKSTPVQILATDPDPIQLIATRAAQWGADQELAACCEWLENQPQWMEDLRSARRPKPPSLKEQALEMLENAWEGGHINNNAAQTIRRALEALPE
jgi:hypothetical protein